MGLRARYLVILLALCLQGCIVVLPVPWYDKPPYDKRALEQYLVPGRTFQSDVLQALGAPNVSWDEGRLLLYAGFEKTGHDLISQQSAGKHHYILLEFDEKKLLRRFDYLEDGQCAAWGLCFEEPLGKHWSYGKFLGFSKQYLVREAVALKAPQANDGLAKRFERIPRKCSFYIYHLESNPPRRPVLCRGNQVCREFKQGSFFHWDQKSENNVVEFSLGHIRLGIVNIGVVDAVDFQTSCESEALIFARVSFKKKRWYGIYEMQVEYVDDEQGKVDVRKLWLMRY